MASSAPGSSVVLADDRGGRIRSFVTALDRFPAEPRWLLVGGFAVNVRIAQIHRLTNDIDTISADQAALVEVLARASDVDQVSHAQLVVSGDPVSIPRRIDSNHPNKVGSDIHDLYRLVAGHAFDDLAQSLAQTAPELAQWVGATLVKWFSPDEDLRYTFARLQRLSTSLDTRAIGEGDLAIVGELGAAVLALQARRDADYEAASEEWSGSEGELWESTARDGLDTGQG